MPLQQAPTTLSSFMAAARSNAAFLPIPMRAQSWCIREEKKLADRKCDGERERVDLNRRTGLPRRWRDGNTHALDGLGRDTAGTGGAVVAELAHDDSLLAPQPFPDAPVVGPRLLAVV